MSRRDQIRMTDAEIAGYLDGRHTMNVASIGPEGRPHLVAMWYARLDGLLAFWTYGRSQKVKNIERDPRLTCLVETGDTYDQLKGVEIVGTARVLSDHDSVMSLGQAVYERYSGPWSDEAWPIIEQMGAKRVAVVIDADKYVSWDHTKLGGSY